MCVCLILHDKVLQFLTGWKSSISTTLKNSSFVDQGAPNLWSRCWCWSRGSKRNVIVSDARDSHCHSACNAGVNKSKVKLLVAGHFFLVWSLSLKNGPESRQSVPSSLSPGCRIHGPMWCLGWLAQRRREMAAIVKFLHSLVKLSQVMGRREVWCLFICQLSPFPLWSLWISVQALKESLKDTVPTLASTSPLPPPPPKKEVDNINMKLKQLVWKGLQIKCFSVSLLFKAFQTQK